MDGNQGPPFKVDRLLRVNQKISSLFLQAKKLGIDEFLVETLERVLELLRDQPLSWGDPVRKTVLEGGVILRGIYKPLVVHYAAFEKERVVMILDINPFPGHGFEEI
jgi:hypothetical protein